MTRDDLQLLREALVYRRKRALPPGDAVRLRGVLDRVEELLLSPQGSRLALRLSPPEQELLRREVPFYREALTQRGSSGQGEHLADRLDSLVAELTGANLGARGLWNRLRKYLKRYL